MNNRRKAYLAAEIAAMGGPDTTQGLSTMEQEAPAGSYAAVGRYSESEALYRELIPVLTKAELSDAGKPAEAEKIMRQVRSIR